MTIHEHRWQRVLPSHGEAVEVCVNETDPCDEMRPAPTLLAQATSLDVERLAEAIRLYNPPSAWENGERVRTTWNRPDPRDAASIAATYAALQSTTAPECICGLDKPGDGARSDIVCPKHDGVFVIPTPEP